MKLAHLLSLAVAASAAPVAEPAEPARPPDPAAPAEPATPSGQQPIPSGGSHKCAIEPLFSDLSTAYTEEFLKTFTNFTNRAAYSEHGVASQHWLMGQIEAATSGLEGIKVEEHDCGQLQKSLIVKLPSKDSGAVTILGAHQDSIGSHSVTSDPYGPDVPAPGAEDNGSGVASLLDSLRILALHKYQPQTPLEFHFYAAEEISRLGSKAIAKEYRDRGVQVRGMMNLDMTGYCPDEGNVTLAVSTVQTDEGLSTWTRQAIAAYLPEVHQMTSGPMESDHVSFSELGFPTTTLVDGEPRNNGLAPPVRTMHKVTDRVDQEGFSYLQIQRFSKLAVAFAVELTFYQ